MTLAIERKRLIGFSMYFSLFVNTVALIYFSKKILMNTLSLLLEITKRGKKYLPEKNIIQINSMGYRLYLLIAVICYGAETLLSSMIFSILKMVGKISDSRLMVIKMLNQNSNEESNKIDRRMRLNSEMLSLASIKKQFYQ